MLVLDGFTGYRMAEILDERPEIRKRLAGFTYYPRAIASAQNTPAGSSAILTGSLETAIEVANWNDRNSTSLEKSFLAQATKNGIDVSYISSLVAQGNPIPSVDEQRFFPRQDPSMSERLNLYVTFLRLSASRVFPGVVLRLSAGLERGILASTTDSEESDADVFNRLTAPGVRLPIASKMAYLHFLKTLRAGDLDSRVIFLLSKVSHSPWNFSEQGRYREGAGPGSSSHYAAWLIVALVDKLEDLGMFDKTLVAIVSDHGQIPVNDPRMGMGPDGGGILPVAFNPLVMVKPIGAKDELRVSDMTVWLGDVSATVRDAFGFPPGDASRLQTRSLLSPDSPDRTINVPLFFKPDDADYHGPLKEWVRVDVSGTFADYVKASSSNPETMLSTPSTITLRAGQDAFLTRLVAEGWMSGKGLQYAAWIEINGRVIAKMENSGVAVLTNATGNFVIERFRDWRDGLAFLREIPESASVFAAGVRVPRERVVQEFGKEVLADDGSELVNFVFASSGRSDPRALLEVGSKVAEAELRFR